jgi:hypothetical protein
MQQCEHKNCPDCNYGSGPCCGKHRDKKEDDKKEDRDKKDDRRTEAKNNPK